MENNDTNIMKARNEVLSLFKQLEEGYRKEAFDPNYEAIRNVHARRREELYKKGNTITGINFGLSLIMKAFAFIFSVKSDYDIPVSFDTYKQFKEKHQTNIPNSTAMKELDLKSDLLNMLESATKRVYNKVKEINYQLAANDDVAVYAYNQLVDYLETNDFKTCFFNIADYAGVDFGKSKYNTRNTPGDKFGLLKIIQPWRQEHIGKLEKIDVEQKSR